MLESGAQDREHHPWELRIMRTEDTGQRAKEYCHSRSTQRNKDERDNVGVGSGRGRKIHDIMEAKERQYQERENPKCKTCP